MNVGLQFSVNLAKCLEGYDQEFKLFPKWVSALSQSPTNLELLAQKLSVCEVRLGGDNDFHHHLLYLLQAPRQTPDKMVSAKKHVPIIKKHPKKWHRHQSDTFKCVPSAWRKPKGIDNRVRRRFKGQMVMPSIGYGSNKKTRHLMPSGHKAFLVHNPRDVDILLMHNRTYAAEIASAVSSRKRVEIVAKAKALGVKVTNPKAKITTES